MSTHQTVPKLCGADIELGSFLVRPAGWTPPPGVVSRAKGWYANEQHPIDAPDDEAARAVLAEVDGIPALRWGAPRVADAAISASRSWSSGGHLPPPAPPVENPQDRARKFLKANGGCVYIDLDHLELCLPEVTSAFDHAAAWHAMLRIAGDALTAANAIQPRGQRIHLLANNSDGSGHSWGSHLDFLITRRAFDDLFHRKLQHLLWLASFQVSSIVFTGAGKAGAENYGPGVPFQLSQRADFMETLVGTQTTFARPLVNSRDEPLCGRGRWASAHAGERELARLHVIFFDSTLSHTASLLKVGVMQIILAMLEVERVDLTLVLDDPLTALRSWSRDPSLSAVARTIQGAELTAVALQTRFLERASTFVAEGGCDGIVPRADEILALWAESLDTLRSGVLEQMATRFDWALKLSQLQEAMRRHPSLTWQSPEIKHLDHVFSSLDQGDGLYWACERGGLVKRLVTDAQIETLVHEPPTDTRAWTRAHLLRRLGASGVEEVDWDFIRCALRDDRGLTRTRAINLRDPLAMTRASTEQLFQQAPDDHALLDALESTIDKQLTSHSHHTGQDHERATSA